MASFNIHLAVGKRYAEKSNLIENLEDFYRGLVAPDLVDDKKFSHFSGILDKSNLIDYLSNKVLLNEYLLAKEVNSCYEKGVFLHLVTDYLFFNDFFDKWYLENISYENFCKDLYFSYNLSNNYLEKKYKLKHSVSLDLIEENIKKNRKEKKITDDSGNNILPEIKLEEFIEKVSDIDLEKYKEKILKANKNVLP